MKAFSLAAFLLITPAMSAEHAERCVPLDVAKRVVSDKHGVWVGLTSDQLQFLRGVSVMHPNTPNGIPLGDGAAMATAAGKESAVVFFLDGNRACDAMPIPDVMRKMVLDVGSGVVKHEGDGL